MTVVVHAADCAVTKAIRIGAPEYADKMTCTCRPRPVPVVRTADIPLEYDPHPTEAIAGELRTVVARLLLGLPALQQIADLLEDPETRRQALNLADALGHLAVTLDTAVDTIHTQQTQLGQADQLQHWLARRLGLPGRRYAPIVLIQHLQRTLFVGMHDGRRPYTVNNQPIQHGGSYRWTCPHDGWQALWNHFDSLLAAIDQHLQEAHGGSP